MCVCLCANVNLASVDVSHNVPAAMSCVSKELRMRRFNRDSRLPDKASEISNRSKTERRRIRGSERTQRKKSKFYTNSRSA